MLFNNIIKLIDIFRDPFYGKWMILTKLPNESNLASSQKENQYNECKNQDKYRKVWNFHNNSDLVQVFKNERWVKSLKAHQFFISSS